MYTGEILDGTLGAHYDSVFLASAANAAESRKLLQLLFDSYSAENSFTRLDAWHDRLDMPTSDFHRLVDMLSMAEMIRSKDSPPPCRKNHVLMLPKFAFSYRNTSARCEPWSLENS